MADKFYTSLMDQVTSPLQNYINSTAAAIIGAIAPVATTLLMIYTMFWGWSMIRGVITEPVTDGIHRIVKLTVVCAIALSLGYYSQFLVDWLWQSPDRMAAIIAGGQVNDKIHFLDVIFGMLWHYSDLWREAADKNTHMGIPDISLTIMSWVICIAAILLTGYAAFLFVLSKIALAVMLAIGPMFVLSTMFESTKRFFDSWIGQVLSFGFVVILTSAILKLTGAFLENSLKTSVNNAQAAGPGFSDAVMIIAICVVIILLLFQVSSIASALGGGTAVNTMGAVGWAFNKIKGASQAGYRLASGRLLSDWRSRRRQAATNARWAQNNPSMAARGARAVANRFKSNSSNTVGKNK
ncbi:conjugal transfer protein (plasmid) [Acidovorax sp. 210-6]|uniref:type IV secretion system protein n=1 Tax=Acidovorax sp. 210-6 TaxID=2699468 RepID=UPI001389D555|nr:type IV secretion system protein [Acidovorax sp. 210-6]NCU67972.1 conjugal transfer protein [Acidovorax sp. 210-6]